MQCARYVRVVTSHVHQPSGPWLTDAVASVERCITRLFDDFVRDPFTHRVEHSLHLDLYHLLRNEVPLQGMKRIGDSPYRTRLVHKEWPSITPVALRGTAERRQSYDIAVLDPQAVRDASLDRFIHGRIDAAIAIELGLDYSLDHLQGDLRKLTTNPVSHRYVVHFSRKRSRLTDRIEELVTHDSDVRVAFMHLDADLQTFRKKGLNDRDITDGRYQPSDPTSS